jgi:RsiW-degrading membrane proteinase PrsW (M82 family)
MLFENHNLFPFILTFAPALLYAFIIFVSFPTRTIKLKNAFLYFLLGSISVHAVSAVQWILPNWGTIGTDLYPNDFIKATVLLAFVQVGLLEEGAKLIFYRFANMYRGRLPQPLAIMFYAMCISTGFAVVENMMYAWRFGPDVLWVRAASAIILHMLAGLIMGYFISLGIYKKQKYLYRTIGLLSAVFIHGLYDFNIMIGYKDYYLMTGEIVTMPTGLGVNSWYILGPGIVVVLLMFLHLRKLSKGKKRASLPSEK